MRLGMARAGTLCTGQSVPAAPSPGGPRVMTLRIETELVDGWLQTIAVGGELDAYSAPGLQDAVTHALDQNVSWLIVDLRRVEYMDSVGLGILIGGVKRAGEKNGGMAVVCERPNVARVFEVSGTAELLNVVDSLPRAVEVLSGARAARTGSESAGDKGGGGK